MRTMFGLIKVLNFAKSCFDLRLFENCTPAFSLERPMLDERQIGLRPQTSHKSSIAYKNMVSQQTFGDELRTKVIQ